MNKSHNYVQFNIPAESEHVFNISCISIHARQIHSKTIYSCTNMHEQESNQTTRTYKETEGITITYGVTSTYMNSK